MLIFVVEEDLRDRKALARAVSRAKPGAEVRAFDRPGAALEALADGGARPDAVFTAIEMAELPGLELAGRLRRIAPETPVVFVTAHAEYALRAYQAHVRGYLLKPATPARVREELEAIFPEVPRKLEIRCFGAFEVFSAGRPVTFRRGRTKELLAFLVDRRGEPCTAGEIITALWEGGVAVANPQAYLRVLTADLLSALRAIGMEDVLLREHRQWAVDRRLLECDYFRLLDGDPGARAAFQGEYMSQYSWAEPTKAWLHFHMKK